MSLISFDFPISSTFVPQNPVEHFPFLGGSLPNALGLNFNGFLKGLDPTPIRDVTLAEINVPVRIGAATCMPGDIVLGTPTGVTFIPPQLAEEVVERSEAVRLRDYFGQMRIREGVYTPGEVDRKWSDEMEADFAEWNKTHGLEVLD